VWSIVVAGGAGRRFGEMKQFSLLGGRPVLEWAVDACRAVSAGVVLVLPADALGAPGSPGSDDTHGADVVVAGGPTRAESVRCGLAAVPALAEVIVVHDAARPLASPDTFDAVLAALDDDVAGAIPGLAPSDTIKAVDPGGIVTGTLDRSTLVAVQTPQAFAAEVLRSAHRLGTAGGGSSGGVDGPPATDDAMLVEATGGRVRVVPGQPDNVKITTADDLEAAERLLAARRTRRG
jgi:2-C-methyl-D-erythritol 4-phosphate cytidylyltransferase